MEEKMLCPKCGEDINKDFAECPYCGKNLSSDKIDDFSQKEEESVIQESYVELTENEALVKKLKTISTIIKFIFYLGAIFFVCMIFIADDETLILPNIIYAIACFIMGLVGTVFIEWMALILETLDEIKNKK